MNLITICLVGRRKFFTRRSSKTYENAQLKLESFMFPRNLGQFFSNKNATGLLNRVYTNEVDLIHCSVFHQQSRTEFLSATRLFYSDKSILIIPSFVRIGPLRKLLLPFEFFTWMALLLLLFLTCLVVTILKFSPPDVEVRR